MFTRPFHLKGCGGILHLVFMPLLLVSVWVLVSVQVLRCLFLGFFRRFRVQ